MTALASGLGLLPFPLRGGVLAAPTAAFAAPSTGSTTGTHPRHPVLGHQRRFGLRGFEPSGARSVTDQGANA